MKTKNNLSAVTAALIESGSANIHKTVLTTLLIAITVIGITVKYAGADMVSMDSSFGPDTITHDTETGLKWLDVNLSTPYSYDEILIELEPGRTFAGYKLATDDEIKTFWQNAGINIGIIGSWATENFQPIVDLMALVGITTVGGGGPGIDWTTGHIKNRLGSGWVLVANIVADHNSPVTGMVSFGTVPSNNENDKHGSWLFAKPNLSGPSRQLLLLDD